MRLIKLELKNIGPFIEEELEFISEEDSVEKPPVVIITGENGTGKTIILDAIRGLMIGSLHGQPKIRIERHIIRGDQDFSLSLTLNHGNSTYNLLSSEVTQYNHFKLSQRSPFEMRFALNAKPDSTWDWVIDYWTSKLSTDSFDIKSLVAPVVGDLYLNSLDGIHQNIEVIKLIVFFDYLRSSENSTEKQLGDYLYDVLKKIIKLGLTNGELKYVARTRLQPIVAQMGYDVSIDKLSSGNLYFLQRMISVLGKMYCLHVLNKTPLEELCNASGILLIDEAENHLHPKWQKTFLTSIQEIFPNLQIIVTTHSPFIVASVENAKVFVCTPNLDHAAIMDETATYSNQPIDEILLSPLLGATQPFNQQITCLLKERKEARQSGDEEKRKNIERELQSINPNYFDYFDIDEALEKLKLK